MRRAILIGAAALAYLLVMAFFAFRPFRPIPGLQYAHAQLECKDGAVHVRRDAALEDRRDVAGMYEALARSGKFSLEVVLRTDSLRQLGPAVVVAFSRDCNSRNFELGQQGNGLEFRLRTTKTDHGGLRTCLLVPQVLDTNRFQRVVATYDGKKARMYIDGRLCAENADVRGGFANWGHNQILVVGDEPTGGDGWAGLVRRFAIYDRALESGEVGRLDNGEAVPGAVLAADFGGGLPDGLSRLRYRNLFIVTDPAAYQLGDCLFNIVGFVPLGLLAYLALPFRMERRKLLAVAAPLLAGLAASGTIEFLQRYVAGRVPCALDIVYNTTGALLGGLLAWLAHSTFENKTINGRNR